MSVKIYGSITRDLYFFWQARTEAPSHLSARNVPELFHDMELYPSTSQVHEMLQCASKCSGRQSSDYITFGEFCVFASELKGCYDKKMTKPVPLSKLTKKNGTCGICHHDKKNLRAAHSMKYDVFLGGSCNPTTWRQEIAIPMLKSQGVTFYNPQVTHWGPELIELEDLAKQSAEVLFFVVDNQTRSTASMIEVAHIAGTNRKLIVVIKRFEPGQKIYGETVTKDEYYDLSHAQAITQDLVEKQGIPVFDNIAVALGCAAKVLREGINVQDLTLADFAQPVKMGHVQLGDKLLKLRETFDVLDTTSSGELNLTDVCLAFRTLTNRDLSMQELRHIIRGQKGDPLVSTDHVSLEDVKVNFDQFCCIFSEYKDKVTDNHCVVDMVMHHTSHVFHHLMTPVTKLFEWLLPHRSSLQGSLTSASYSLSPHGVRDVFLGGSCGICSWREDIVIPVLRKNGLTYFNPQTSCWSERLLPLEMAAIDASRVLLFVISNTSRSLSAMSMAAHYIGLGCNVVLCIQYLWDGIVLNGEMLSSTAVKDYNRGRSYLADLANRDGVPVFEDIVEAAECVIQKLRSQV